MIGSLWRAMWPNIFAPSAFTLLGVGVAHVRTKAHLHRQNALAERHQAELQAQAIAHQNELKHQAERHHQQALTVLEGHHESLRAYIKTAAKEASQ